MSKNSPYEGDASQAIPVHVISLPAMPTPMPPQLRYHTVCDTIQINPLDAVTELLPASELRVEAWIQALDEDVVIHTNRGHAARGHGTLIPANNTAPWPIKESGPMYVAAASQPPTGPLRVSVSVTYLGG